MLPLGPKSQFFARDLFASASEKTLPFPMLMILQSEVSVAA